MLSLLLDENISPVVSMQIQTKRADIRIQCLHTWHEGEYLGLPDEAVLLAAHKEGLTLVTYDTQILSDLAHFFADETEFSGLIFVDDKTIAGSDFGAPIRALIYLWDHEQASDWTNRLIFLPSPPRNVI
jgi:hypothetical protein